MSTQSQPWTPYMHSPETNMGLDLPPAQMPDFSTIAEQGRQIVDDIRTHASIGVISAIGKLSKPALAPAIASLPITPPVAVTTATVATASYLAYEYGLGTENGVGATSSIACPNFSAIKTPNLPTSYDPAQAGTGSFSLYGAILGDGSTNYVCSKSVASYGTSDFHGQALYAYTLQNNTDVAQSPTIKFKTTPGVTLEDVYTDVMNKSVCTDSTDTDGSLAKLCPSSPVPAKGVIAVWAMFSAENPASGQGITASVINDPVVDPPVSVTNTFDVLQTPTIGVPDPKQQERDSIKNHLIFSSGKGKPFIKLPNGKCEIVPIRVRLSGDIKAKNPTLITVSDSAVKPRLRFHKKRYSQLGQVYRPVAATVCRLQGMRPTATFQLFTKELGLVTSRNMVLNRKGKWVVPKIKTKTVSTSGASR